MLTPYRLARVAWHLVPDALRSAAPVRRLSARVTERLASHDERYDVAYYAEIVERTAAPSAPHIAQSIVRDLNPQRLLDVGCGTGDIMAALRDRGVDVAGLEYSAAGLARCRAKGLRVQSFDLEQDRLEPAEPPYDVVLSTEVAEHLPERLADAFVDALCSQGRTIVFTAATPGQGGVDHVNEQPHSYWLAKFRVRGFRLDAGLTEGWRAEWQGATAPWYAANVLVLRGE